MKDENQTTKNVAQSKSPSPPPPPKPGNAELTYITENFSLKDIKTGNN